MWRERRNLNKRIYARGGDITWWGAKFPENSLPAKNMNEFVEPANIFVILLSFKSSFKTCGKSSSHTLISHCQNFIYERLPLIYTFVISFSWVSLSLWLWL